jgi:large conductance mechanosensitive channel
MIGGFQRFLLQGNVVQLAVGVVIGVAFGDVVDSLVKNFLTPLIAAVGGQPDFSELAFTINNSRFGYGEFINTLISFVLIAATIYFAVVLPLNAVASRLRMKPLVYATIPCPECLTEIPELARRCFSCGEPVAPLAGASPAAPPPGE